MIYIFESDGSGGQGISDIFEHAFGKDHFARFYCPAPIAPYLETSRIPYLKSYFQAAKGIAANIFMELRSFRETFPFAKTAIVISNPVAASLRSYHEFLTVYAKRHWPNRETAPAEFSTFSAFLEHIRGTNYLVRALAQVPSHETPREKDLEKALSVLCDFDHLIIAEDLRLSLVSILSNYPETLDCVGKDQDRVCQNFEKYLRFDVMHVNEKDIQQALKQNALDCMLYAEALQIRNARMH